MSTTYRNSVTGKTVERDKPDLDGHPRWERVEPESKPKRRRKSEGSGERVRFTGEDDAE